LTNREKASASLFPAASMQPAVHHYICVKLIARTLLREGE
jgi:hypothetical protein